VNVSKTFVEHIFVSWDIPAKYSMEMKKVRLFPVYNIFKIISYLEHKRTVFICLCVCVCAFHSD